MREKLHTEISEILLTARKSTKTRRFPVLQQNPSFRYNRQFHKHLGRLALVLAGSAAIALGSVRISFAATDEAPANRANCMVPVLRGSNNTPSVADLGNLSNPEDLKSDGFQKMLDSTTGFTVWVRKAAVDQALKKYPDCGAAPPSAPRAAQAILPNDPAGALGATVEKGKQAYSARDFAQALVLFEEAAAQGSPLAQTFLGLMYQNGQGVAQDYAQALSWYRKAAEQNFAPAETSVGAFYLAGDGVAEDDAEAARWLLKAAAQGQPLAQYLLGVMYYSGQGVPKDFAQALAWNRKAAEQNNLKAQVKLGLMYQLGQGGPVDYAAALTWYEKAAAQNDDNAELLIGDMYLLGQGVPQDYPEAVMWLRKAADQNNSQAQYLLGEMYQVGLGLKSNMALARSWYQKSAAQGNETARGRLTDLDELQQVKRQAAYNSIPAALQVRCFLQEDVRSLHENVPYDEAKRRRDACLRSSWKRLFGDKPFPGD